MASTARHRAEAVCLYGAAQREGGDEVRPRRGAGEIEARETRADELLERTTLVTEHRNQLGRILRVCPRRRRPSPPRPEAFRRKAHLSARDQRGDARAS